ncbi:MAG: ferrochelatase [Gammaproteobacteria bacterium]
MSNSLTGVLLINLGTPATPTVSAVRKFLREFLADPRVIDIPAPLRYLILYGFILPTRPFKVAHAYKAIWLADGSPLMVYSRNLQAALTQRLAHNSYVISLGMRYGKPSIADGLAELMEHKCNRIIVVPLFPQYSSAASGSAIAKTLDVLSQQWNIPQLTILDDFFNHAQFIYAQAQVIKQKLANRKPDLVLFSYHGLPERHVSKSGCVAHCDRLNPCPAIERDNRYCYRAQCYATSHALAQALDLSAEKYQTSFQSRLGRTPWIKPYSDELLPQLYAQGIRHLAIACPSFVADCLETLEEVGIRAQEQWHELGGNELTLIPCLNDDPVWVNALATIITEAQYNPA